MSSERGNEPRENTEGYFSPLQARSSPYDYRVGISYGGRSHNLYCGRSPTNAMSAYGYAVDVAKFLGCSALIDIRLMEPRSPHAVFGGFTTKIEQGRVTAYHQPYGRCSEWPVVAGATFKREVRWQGILMFPLFEKAVKARLQKL